MSVEFKVPGDFVVQQSPHNLPPVYRGEKMVVYGIMTPMRPSADNEITGKAILRGEILGKKMEHSVAFTFNPVSSSRVSLPTIHHLAAKALIKDWQDEEKSKEEIVKLSVESSVISSHTAFIAVDEENSEPVAGAMKTWDVQASEESRLHVLQQQVHAVRSIMSSNIDQAICRGERLDDLSDKADALNSSAAVFSKGAAKKKSGFSFSSLFSGLTSRLYGSRAETSRSTVHSYEPKDMYAFDESEGARASPPIPTRFRAEIDSDDDKEFDIDDVEEEEAAKVTNESPRRRS